MDIGRNIKLKRVYDAPADSDGYRVLATRYWPRGVPRSQATEYISMLAPSKELVAEHKRGALSWPDFESRYSKELSQEAKQDELKRLAGIAKKRTITLLCFCLDERGCHRTLLRQAIIEVA